VTLKYDVSEAESWDDEKAAEVIAFLKTRPWLQSDLDAVYEARGGEPEIEAENAGEGPYADLTAEELHDELQARGLPVSGNKAELIARLQEADA
jgi:hypothetical protein